MIPGIQGDSKVAARAKPFARSALAPHRRASRAVEKRYDSKIGADQGFLIRGGEKGFLKRGRKRLFKKGGEKGFLKRGRKRLFKKGAKKAF